MVEFDIKCTDCIYGYEPSADGKSCTPCPGCTNPITGECSFIAPCPPRNYCFEPPVSINSETDEPLICTAYPEAQCKFTSCGGCTEYYEDSQGTIITLDECNIDICTLPVECGPCESRITRYFYDAFTETCEEFFYGGCDGTANNFETLEECQSTCADQQS